jgi:hypothetical protein
VSSVRILLVCSEGWLGVKGTTVLLVVGMVLSVVLEQGLQFVEVKRGLGWAGVGRGSG